MWLFWNSVFFWIACVPFLRSVQNRGLIFRGVVKGRNWGGDRRVSRVRSVSCAISGFPCSEASHAWKKKYHFNDENLFSWKAELKLCDIWGWGWVYGLPCYVACGCQCYGCVTRGGWVWKNGVVGVSGFIHTPLLASIPCKQNDITTTSQIMVLNVAFWEGSL